MVFARCARICAKFAELVTAPFVTVPSALVWPPPRPRSPRRRPSRPGAAGPSRRSRRCPGWCTPPQDRVFIYMHWLFTDIDMHTEAGDTYTCSVMNGRVSPNVAAINDIDQLCAKVAEFARNLTNVIGTSYNGFTACSIYLSFIVFTRNRCFLCSSKVEWGFVNIWVKFNNNCVTLNKHELMLTQFDSILLDFTQMFTQFHNLLLEKTISNKKRWTNNNLKMQ